MHREGQPMITKTLRQKLINIDTRILEPHEQWLNDYHYILKDEALRDFVENNNSNMAKRKSTGVPFKLNFKSRKARNQNLSVLKKFWNNKSFFYCDIFSSSKILSAEKLPEKLPMDFRLQRTGIIITILLSPWSGRRSPEMKGVRNSSSLTPG